MWWSYPLKTSKKHSSNPTKITTSSSTAIDPITLSISNLLINPPTMSSQMIQKMPTKDEESISCQSRFWMPLPFRMTTIWIWLIGLRKTSWPLAFPQAFTCGMQITRKSINFVIWAFLIQPHQWPGHLRALTSQSEPTMETFTFGILPKWKR
jgi:hypothetical protein